ncbi:acetyl-CoA synthetase-like protein [Aulographum hederae CBS 113979]|uniref:Acetyl-CoA synthetase-like protein n=1 Tax=Aulographum hederae CBS 113979 TaxID=1176131 RepID=A0A6G1GRA5_9PEZI|nr:acetyl-CoA synthetase-like protein [Aulographum hederae CBS 113979]
MPFVRGELWLPTKNYGPYRPSCIRTLPELVEHNAKHNADYIFCRQVLKKGADLGFRDITHGQLKTAILNCQDWLLGTFEHLERQKLLSNISDFGRPRPVALFMDSDVGLWIHLLALAGLGVPCFGLSARLSPTAIGHLLKESGARGVIASDRLHSTAKEGIVLAGSMDDSIELHAHKSWDVLLGSDSLPAPDGRPVYTPEHFRSDEEPGVFLLHSSGTTGLPKVQPQTHAFLLQFGTIHALDDPQEAENFNFSMLPLYHGFGLVAAGLSMSVGLTVCLPHSAICSAESVIASMALTDARSLMVAPSTLEDLSLLEDRRGIDAMLPLQFVAFGGGPLKMSVGESLAAAGVNLVNHYGASDICSLAPIFAPKPDSNYDWHYFRVRQDLDLDITRLEDSNPDDPRFTLSAFPPGLKGLVTLQDQLACNPNKPDTDFKTVGRNDDWIVLATGEKVLPGLMENTLAESEFCKTALVFGQSRFEVGILVEPKKPLNQDQLDDFKSDIWPIIEQANTKMDAQSQVTSKSAICIVTDGARIPRTDKGTIKRKDAYEEFEKEIDQVYLDLESMTDPSVPALDMNRLEAALKSLIQDRLSWKVPTDAWTDADDLFDLGMDSLQALKLRRLLVSSMPSSPKGSGPSSPVTPITREFVYLNSSVEKLARAIRGQGAEKNGIEEYLDEFTLDSPSSNGHVVLLTGSTGSLGSHLLAHLADLPDVNRIICLDRIPQSNTSDSPLARVVSAAEDKGIKFPTHAISKISALQTNSASPLLGLDHAAYNELAGSITHIIHNAWPVDFKRRLASFKSQFRVLQNLIDLALAASKQSAIPFSSPPRKPSLLFISTIATAAHHTSLTGETIVPEIPMSKESVAEIGYAQAKFVCEKMIERAAAAHGNEMQAKYIRVGQMSGALRSGYWNEKEHFPALVRSSFEVGALPVIKGTLSWLPVDQAAASISDIALCSSSSSGSTVVYHLENPIRQSWHDGATFLPAPELPNPSSPSPTSSTPPKPLPLLPYPTWLSKVRTHAPSSSSPGPSSRNPVLTLLDFFENGFEHMAQGEVVLGMENARAASATLRRVRVVGEEGVERYVGNWRGRGLLG